MAWEFKSKPLVPKSSKSLVQLFELGRYNEDEDTVANLSLTMMNLGPQVAEMYTENSEFNCVAWVKGMLESLEDCGFFAMPANKGLFGPLRNCNIPTGTLTVSR
jgi:hypothetical protein